jgi:fructokinase
MRRVCVASYRFLAPAAWDFLDTSEAAIASARGATLVYGTLAQRTPAAEAIERLPSVARVRVFDANLRAPHDEATAELAALGKATFVRLSGEELQRFSEWLQFAADPAVLGRLSRRNLGLRPYA